VGKHEQIVLAIAVFLAEGHLLIEDVPGVAKTMLARAIAQSAGCTFKRIQCTPDLQPSDVLGEPKLDPQSGRTEFRFGPIFSQFVLVDEINRASPRTQSALLEAMGESMVTTGNITYRLQRPFMVLATQNPIEQEGTYPLPEAQLDRFMFNLWLEYPSFQEEIDIVKSTTSPYTPAMSHILDAQEIIAFQDLIRRVPVADSVVQYAVQLVARTRPKDDRSPKFIRDWLTWGAGPRASQYLILGAKTRAILSSRHNPDIDDVRAMAVPVLRHRIIPNFNAEADGVTAVSIVEKLLANE